MARPAHKPSGSLPFEDAARYWTKAVPEWRGRFDSQMERSCYDSHRDQWVLGRERAKGLIRLLMRGRPDGSRFCGAVFASTDLHRARRLQVERLREAELHLRSRCHPKRTNRNSGAQLSCCVRLCLQLESTISFNWYSSSPARNRSEIYGQRVGAMPISSRCLNPAEDFGPSRK